MLEIKNLEKRYRGFGALKSVSLEINQGEIIGLFGENGAGKSTLMKCALGLITPNSGEILLDGEKVTAKNIERISYASCEHTFFPLLTGKSHKEFMQEHYPNFNTKRYEMLMEFFGLNETKVLKRYSTGEKNQFEVILALCQGADYIFLDEPFVGNDIFNREDFYKILLGILEENETIILSTHLIDEIDNFISRAVLVNEGKIIGDITVDELDEKGISLMDYVKDNYHYDENRVSKAYSKMMGE